MIAMHRFVTDRHPSLAFLGAQTLHDVLDVNFFLLLATGDDDFVSWVSTGEQAHWRPSWLQSVQKELRHLLLA